MNKVLFVNIEGQLGGAERSLLLLAKYLRNDFHIAVACPAGSPLAEQLACMGIDSFIIPHPPSRSFIRIIQIIHLAKTSYRIIKIAHNFKPSIIHANNFYAAVASILSVAITRQKLLWHARDLTRFKLAPKICSFFCTRVIAVSNAVKESLIKKGIKPVKIVVVHNGIELDTSRCDIPETVQSKSVNTPVTFANVGQFVPWKKQALFIEAACRLIQKNSNAMFFLVGDDIFGGNPEYKAGLLNKIRNSETAEKIALLGWQENMNEVWSKIDCLVHTAAREPFGRVIIEAMGHYVPVIAVNQCGPGEIIQNGKTGILVNPDNIEELSEAMLKIADDKNLALQLASAAYRYVASRFSAETTAEHIREIYQQILAA
jgi:glycosyltransferase involved in cell wall biosynthesis